LKINNSFSFTKYSTFEEFKNSSRFIDIFSFSICFISVFSSSKNFSDSSDSSEKSKTGKSSLSSNC
jgi:hypothetical protein